MGTPPTTPPEVPPGAPTFKVTVTDVTDKEMDPKQQAKLAAEGHKEAGTWANFWANKWGAFGEAAGWVLEQGARIANFFISRLGTVMQKVQIDNAPELADLTGTLIEDLTGAPVDRGRLAEAMKTRGVLAAMDLMGTQIFNLLAYEFLVPEGEAGRALEGAPEGRGIGGLPEGKLSPEQGINAAQRFLGFLSSWAVREGNMRLLLDLLGWDIIEAYQGMGAELARNLSLGRQARAVLRPLTDICVATPLEWALNLQYRPKLMGESTAVRAFLRGAMTHEALLQELGRAGYSVEKINSIIAANELSLTDTDLDRLVRWGVMTDEQAVAELRRRGYSEQTAKQVLEANKLAAADTRLRDEVNRMVNLAADFNVPEEDFQSFIERVPLHEQEKAVLRNIVTLRRGVPSKSLTLGQMRQAFIDGIVDLEEFQDFVREEHYSLDDGQILTIQLLADFKEEEKRRRLQAERDAERERKRAEKAGGTPAPAGTPIVP
jgi:hypothetical protein